MHDLKFIVKIYITGSDSFGPVYITKNFASLMIKQDKLEQKESN